ncbi:MAG: lipid A deacylase LpxR family protein [Proteobacteria bacterium]|nr:lipid A deacylase LpxR family protein [Pseudomonadota bacterium]
MMDTSLSPTWGRSGPFTLALLVSVVCLTTFSTDATAQAEWTFSTSRNAESDKIAVDFYRKHPGFELRSELDNDDLVGMLTQDRSYTLGFRTRFWVRPRQNASWKDGYLMKGDLYRFAVIFGWQIYTPEDIDTATPSPSDRPYAGYMFGGLAIEMTAAGEHRLVLEYNFNVGGPQSQAGPIHNGWRDAFKKPRAAGWDEQLEHELAQNLYLTWDARILRAFPLSAGGHLLNILIHTRTAAGEVLVAQSLGASIAFGWMQRPHRGVPYRETDAAIDSCKSRDAGCRMLRGSQFYVLAGGGLDLVLHNHAVNGTIFAENRSTVEAQILVPDAWFEVVLELGSYVDLGFAIVYRGPEVRAPDGNDPPGHIFQRMSFSLHY